MISRMVSRFGPIALLVGIGMLLLSAPETQFSEAQNIGKDAANFEELSERFRALADEKGALYAFEVLKRAELPPNTDLHLLGHVVGDELYAQQGMDGIVGCTQDFRNACSHTIVIGALNEFGEAALPMIREACRQAPGGSGAYTMCFHGLGHGVFAYYGFSLPETVDFCEKTGTEAYRDREYIECVGGVVMELMGGGGHDRDAWLSAREKYLPPNDALAPCMDGTVPEIAREICLTYLTPRLWEFARIDLGRPEPEKFAAAFSYCDAIPPANQSLRDACFGGFGKEFVPIAGARDIRNIASFSDAEFSRAIDWCEAAGASDGVRACILEGLASIFWGGENDPEASFRYCALVPQLHQAACYEQMAGDIAVYVRDEALRERLCERIPELQRSTCS